MQGLTSGIQAGVHEVKSALSDVTNQIGGVDLSRPRDPRVEQRGTRNTNQTFYITTQEIDPRVHAAQLGFELQAMM